MTKYKDIMNRIELTDEMRERVLKNVKEQAASENAESKTEETTDSSESSVIKCVSSKKKNRTILFHSLALACAALLIATGVFIAWKAQQKVKNEKPGTVQTGSSESTSDTSNDTSGVIAVGTTDDYYGNKVVDSIEEINKEFGLQLSDLTTLPFTPTEISYEHNHAFSAEIVYSRGTEDECIWTIEKADVGVEAIAENYDFSESCGLHKGRQAVLCGYEDVGYSYIYWSDGYRYHSIQLMNPTDRETLMNIANEIEEMV
ncbi:MAG: hypothetical protein J5607_11335 [Clostridiales bacterium]|nr:hypothetical protein [Clostridiales bacterium]MBR4819933.1 hypothetical protein [Clostridiales bacterium]